MKGGVLTPYSINDICNSSSHSRELYLEDNIFGSPAGLTQAVSDRNWVFLKPLPKGEHEITSRGVSLDVTTTATNIFVSDATFDLTVQ